MSRVFFRFHRKLVRKKTQKNTDKASQNNGLIVFLRVSISGVNFVLSFIPSSFYFITFFANFMFLFVPSGKILMPSPRLRLRVCSSGWDTVAAAVADTASKKPGRGCFLCWPLLGRIQRLIRFSEPTIAVMKGVGHHHNFLIQPSSTFFLTYPLSQMSP